jgi:hypothetical protein
MEGSAARTFAIQQLAASGDIPSRLELAEAGLLVISEAGDHVEEFFERDETAAMAKFVLVDCRGQLVDFFPFGVVSISELATFTASPICRSHFAAINKGDGLLLGQLFHYHSLNSVFASRSLVLPEVVKI